MLKQRSYCRIKSDETLKQAHLLSQLSPSLNLSLITDGDRAKMTNVPIASAHSHLLPQAVFQLGFQLNQREIVQLLVRYAWR